MIGRSCVGALRAAATSGFDDEAHAVALAPAAERDSRARTLGARAQALGVWPASVGPLYAELARSRIAPMTVPAVNLRGLTYHLARAAWRAALRREAAPVIFELAPVEAEIGDQSFDEYAAMVFAAAVREGYRGPVFLQADHVEVPSTGSAAVDVARRLCFAAVDAGFRQVDIDAAGLASGADSALERQSVNAAVTAELATYVHGLDPTVVVGGEVGEIGGVNTSVADLRAFLDTVTERLGSLGGALGKVSVQTGTQHGGVVLADGSFGTMTVDFAVAAELARVAREVYGLPGVVQHGASTLTTEQLGRLAHAGVNEVHLATGIQNVVLEHRALPAELLGRMRRDLTGAMGAPEGGHGAEQPVGVTAEQTWIANRWHAWGAYKPELWGLPESILGQMRDSAEAWFDRTFVALGLAGRARDLVGLWKTPD